MKRIGAWVLVLGLVATLGGYAQSPLPPVNAPESPAATHGGHGHHGARLRRMLAQLNLTDDQRGQIRQILQNGQGQNRKVTMRQIRAVLTPEQRQQWRALRQQQRALRRGQGAPQPNPQPQAPGQNT